MRSPGKAERGSPAALSMPRRRHSTHRRSRRSWRSCGRTPANGRVARASGQALEVAQLVALVDVVDVALADALEAEAVVDLMCGRQPHVGPGDGLAKSGLAHPIQDVLHQRAAETPTPVLRQEVEALDLAGS